MKNSKEKRMKKMYIAISIVVLFFNCTLTEPSTILIKNETEYTLSITCNKSYRNTIEIKKGKGEAIFLTPGKLRLTVFIKELGYRKDYILSLAYQEKKKIIISNHLIN